MRSSQTQISTAPVRMPIAACTRDVSHPLSIEYFRKKIAASTSAMPAIAAKSLTPMKLSQSNATAAGLGGVMGGGGGGGGGSTIGIGSGAAIGSGARVGGGGRGGGGSGAVT